MDKMTPALETVDMLAFSRLPDHMAGSRLVAEAVFSAGLRCYPAEGNAWKLDVSCCYFINESATPSFVIDVSNHYETKRQALACLASNR